MAAPLVARIMVEHSGGSSAGGSPPVSPGVANGGNPNGNGNEDLDKTLTGGFKGALKNGKDILHSIGKHINATMGVRFTMAAMLKQSQVFTGYLGSVFQLIGALVDVILAPFLPVFIPAIRLIARLIPDVAKMSKGIFDFLKNNPVSKAIGNFIRGFHPAIGSTFQKALAVIIVGAFFLKIFKLFGLVTGLMKFIWNRNKINLKTQFGAFLMRGMTPPGIHVQDIFAGKGIMAGNKAGKLRGLRAARLGLRQTGVLLGLSTIFTLGFGKIGNGIRSLGALIGIGNSDRIRLTNTGKKVIPDKSLVEKTKDLVEEIKKSAVETAETVAEHLRLVKPNLLSPHRLPKRLALPPAPVDDALRLKAPKPRLALPPGKTPRPPAPVDDALRLKAPKPFKLTPLALPPGKTSKILQPLDDAIKMLPEKAVSLTKFSNVLSNLQADNVTKALLTQDATAGKDIGGKKFTPGGLADKIEQYRKKAVQKARDIMGRITADDKAAAAAISAKVEAERAALNEIDRVKKELNKSNNVWDEVKNKWRKADNFIQTNPITKRIANPLILLQDLDKKVFKGKGGETLTKVVDNLKKSGTGKNIAKLGQKGVLPKLIGYGSRLASAAPIIGAVGELAFTGYKMYDDIDKHGFSLDRAIARGGMGLGIAVGSTFDPTGITSTGVSIGAHEGMSAAFNRGVLGGDTDYTKQFLLPSIFPAVGAIKGIKDLIDNNNNKNSINLNITTPDDVTASHYLDSKNGENNISVSLSSTSRGAILGNGVFEM